MSARKVEKLIEPIEAPFEQVAARLLIAWRSLPFLMHQSIIPIPHCAIQAVKIGLSKLFTPAFQPKKQSCAHHF